MVVPGRSDGRQQGFTILELMVATTVFTVILLVIAAGAISFTNSYFKGVTGSKTQASARSVMATLTQSVQFGQTVTFPASGSVQGVCIDSTLYAYVIGQQVTDTNPQAAQHQAYHGLLQVPGSNCSSGMPPSVAAVLGAPGIASLATLPAGSRELLGEHMRVGVLNIGPAINNLYPIRVRVIYGDDSLMTPAVGASTNWGTEFCMSGLAGSQFCAVSDLSTTVEQRLL